MPIWKPVLGANYTKEQVTFRVWSPDAKSLHVVVGANQEAPMAKTRDGYFTAVVVGARPGTPYSFYVDGHGPLPDPASRYQPEGVHGPSVIIDPASYQWNDAGWRGIPLEESVFYELHVGTFTREGTFQAAAKKLSYLKDLGITSVELMPLSDFAGERNWGYDGVSPFAPARCYGSPDDLRAFVDQAHACGLAVFVDVVYNHFGPDGAYQGTFSKHYYTKHHHTPWGDAINYDDALCEPVREYVIENALRWIYEYHVDGLRLDATDTIKDDSVRHILADLNAAAAEAATALQRHIHLIAEDSVNRASIVKPYSQGGLGFSGVWADDFHHQMRRTLAGDSDGYFATVDGSIPSIAKTARRGWWRGTSDTTGIDYRRFVYCIQNHDQIGNRALGDRLHHSIDWAVYRAASALLLLLPQTPLLFMGQEWAASTPFLYFTDHHAELGQAVTEGRRKEFASFAGFSGSQIPDPQAIETFRASQLRWDELSTEPHLHMLNLYKSLLALRRANPAASQTAPALQISELDENTLLLIRDSLVAVFRLNGQGDVRLCGKLKVGEELWNSEDPRYAPDSQAIRVNHAESRISFMRPGAIVFRVAEKEEC